MTGPYVIGCDIGSQGTNTALYSDDGRLVASAYEAYDVLFPRPGWAEQDPRAWINALHSTLRRVLDEVTEGASAVKAISFASQLDGMVVCDAQGKPLRNAMIWMDRRAEAQAAAMAQRVTREDFYHQVGTNLDSSHAVFKALWVKDEEPDVFARAARLMPPGSFVVQEAAGVSMVDYSNASSLALLDPRTRKWSDAILDAAGLDASMFPELAPGTLGVGSVTEAFAGVYQALDYRLQRAGEPGPGRPLTEMPVTSLLTSPVQGETAEPGWRMYGAAAEIIAATAETLGKDMRSLPRRVTWPQSAVPTSSKLEEQFYPSSDDIVTACRASVIGK